MTEVGPITVTSNPDEVIEAVNSLKAHGGLDCPELGMTGLYQALLQSVQDSVIYYFSDADAKDSNLAPVVLILAKQKKVILNFILSGHCSYKRKRRSAHDSIQLGSQNLYKSLAASTGGQMLMTQKSEVSVVVDIIGSDGVTNNLIQVRIIAAEPLYIFLNTFVCPNTPQFNGYITSMVWFRLIVIGLGDRLE